MRQIIPILATGPALAPFTGVASSPLPTSQGMARTLRRALMTIPSVLGPSGRPRIRRSVTVSPSQSKRCIPQPGSEVTVKPSSRTWRQRTKFPSGPSRRSWPPRTVSRKMPSGAVLKPRVRLPERLVLAVNEFGTGEPHPRYRKPLPHAGATGPCCQAARADTAYVSRSAQVCNRAPRSKRNSTPDRRNIAGSASPRRCEPGPLPLAAAEPRWGKSDVREASQPKGHTKQCTRPPPRPSKSGEGRSTLRLAEGLGAILDKPRPYQIAISVPVAPERDSPVT